MAITEKEAEQFKLNIELQHKLGIPSEMLTPEEALRLPELNIENILAFTFAIKTGMQTRLKQCRLMPSCKKIRVELYTVRGNRNRC